MPSSSVSQVIYLAKNKIIIFLNVNCIHEAGTLKQNMKSKHERNYGNIKEKATFNVEL